MGFDSKTEKKPVTLRTVTYRDVPYHDVSSRDVSSDDDDDDARASERKCVFAQKSSKTPLKPFCSDMRIFHHVSR